MKKRPPKNLMEQVYVRSGSMRDFAKVWQLLLAWSMCMNDRNTSELGIYEFIEWADPDVLNMRTAERYLALFRKAFPGDRDPNRVCVESGLYEGYAPVVDHLRAKAEKHRKPKSKAAGRPVSI